MTRFLDGPYPRVLAHRGWHVGELQPLENTMTAFRAAVDEGLAYIETDVQTSADGRLVVFHDQVLDRVTDGTGPVAALTWDQLRQLSIGGRERLSLLEDVLDAFPHTRFNIDPKTDAAVGPLLDVLAASGAAQRVCIGSFSTRRIAALRQGLGPDVATALAPTEIIPFVRATRLLPGVRPHTAAVAAQIPIRHRRVRMLTPHLIAGLHAAGLEVHVWTVNDSDQMHRLLDMGVDGLITDRPDRAREVLRQRGAWR